MGDFVDRKQKLFARDMAKAGFVTDWYGGRNYYEGLAVKVPRDELQDVIRATTLALGHEQLGKDRVVVWPKP